jgi:hypothetical protein
MLAGGCELARDEAALLVKNIRELNRAERRVFYQRIKPREREIKLYLRERFESGDSREKEMWINATVESMLSRGGDPDLMDCMVMDAIGRIELYKLLRERAENRGVKLSALSNFGGLSMVLYAVVILSAIVLYFYYR